MASVVEYEWFKDLNEEQLKAVTTTQGPILVIAGAGTGKTRVIEYRTLFLIEQGIDPSRVLLLTFTRTAAREMLSRAARHNPLCAKVCGGTFHSYCNSLLRTYGNLIGLPRTFTILDQADSADALNYVVTKTGFSDERHRIPHKRTLRDIIGLSLLMSIPIKTLLEERFNQFTSLASRIEVLSLAFAEFKLKQNVLDYDDLLLFTKLLLEDPCFNSIKQDLPDYIMVDEFHDTNAFEASIARLLAYHDNILVVGDDAQSIYGFKGALHRNIMDFSKWFPNCRLVTLTKNYRSTQAVLDLGNVLLRGMKASYQKSLRAVRADCAVRPTLHVFRSRTEEASHVVDAVLHWRSQGVQLGSQAALYRSGFRKVALELELATRNVPYKVFGGLKFYETAHVKDLVAHIRILANPRDELAWYRALKLLKDIGDVRAREITVLLASVTSATEVVNWLKPSVGRFPELGPFSDRYQELSLAPMNPYTVYWAWLDYYRPLCVRQYDDAWQRIQDLEALGAIVDRYHSLEALLTEVALEPPVSVSRPKPHVRDEEPFVLSTIHSAKGLEWECAYILGVEDGCIPASYAIRTEEMIEEEKRCLYVAVTRCRTTLQLTMSHRIQQLPERSGAVLHLVKPSPFIEQRAVMAALDVVHHEEPSSIAPSEDAAVGQRKEELLRRVIQQYPRANPLEPTEHEGTMAEEDLLTRGTPALEASGHEDHALGAQAEERMWASFLDALRGARLTTYSLVFNCQRAISAGGTLEITFGAGQRLACGAVQKPEHAHHLLRVADSVYGQGTNVAVCIEGLASSRVNLGTTAAPASLLLQSEPPPQESPPVLQQYLQPGSTDRMHELLTAAVARCEARAAALRAKPSQPSQEQSIYARFARFRDAVRSRDLTAHDLLSGCQHIRIYQHVLELQFEPAHTHSYHALQQPEHTAALMQAASSTYGPGTRVFVSVDHRPGSRVLIGVASEEREDSPAGHEDS